MRTFNFNSEVYSPVKMFSLWRQETAPTLPQSEVQNK